jgi:phage terminase large subunit
LLTEGNPASGFIKDRYKDQSREVLESKGIYFLEGQTSDNPWITQAYIDRLIANYPRWWLDRYLYGLWDNREELIYSEFNEKIHVTDIIDPGKIHRDYIRRNGFDWGWVNPTACLFSYVDYDGILTIFDEYYKPSKGMLLKTIADDCNKYGTNWTIADYQMKGLKLPSENENQHEDKTVWSELERFGLKLLPCNKEELSNIVLANTLFKTNKVRITRNCINTIREWKNWKWKRIKLGSDRDAPEEPTDKDNHTCDAFNYLVANIYGASAEDSAKKKLHDESILKAIITPDRPKIISLS